MRKIVPGGAIQAVSHASLPRDRIFNRGALTIGAGPLPRKQRCAGDGASATARVYFAGRSAQGPGGRPGAGVPEWDGRAPLSPRRVLAGRQGAYLRESPGVGGRAQSA